MAGTGSWIIPGTVPCETLDSCEPGPDDGELNCVILYE